MHICATESASLCPSPRPSTMRTLPPTKIQRVVSTHTHTHTHTHTRARTHTHTFLFSILFYPFSSIYSNMSLWTKVSAKYHNHNNIFMPLTYGTVCTPPHNHGVVHSTPSLRGLLSHIWLIYSVMDQKACLCIDPHKRAFLSLHRQTIYATERQWHRMVSFRGHVSSQNGLCGVHKRTHNDFPCPDVQCF